MKIVLESFSCKTMELKWVVTTPKTHKPKSLSLPQTSLPIFISTKPSHVNPDELRGLFGACKLSTHRFPAYADESCSDTGHIVDVRKLRVALSHSSFVVSVFCKSQDIVSVSASEDSSSMGIGDFLQTVMEPVTPQNGELIGFGRAVSDMGLTASIYDVMVAPPLRGLGIGKMIVQRIIRMLTSWDIYDIAALCSENERQFFENCGFGDDILSSTTMMYTRTVSASSEGNHMTKRFGRKLLLVPPLKCTLRFRNQ
ncbi:GCN5-related N-acetyltransferase 3, chloroplastic [Humulus lupulus]|uniref:GCN5-related N-acetyltransferase 3, chloroplastic n=1 Tax=Humulus lupulus TaxID=3486 RepID=UPI002B40BDBF|nr:GCN5-related N-acetyltransferase 3, chloroplastic [Humulus lupulus]